MRDHIFTAIYDPGYDCWLAVKVYADGNPIILDRFATENEAQDCAEALRQDYVAENSQFGVGA